ncbi:MAG: histidinol-phosphatase [Rickettsiales bacterium]|nr:histidinol-phosphatase [Pseudomonadota bacterium]MDA0965533.1 histidinol-phosphatase [Pseudomonadota bacterium]MDG4542857.1 histidinol-phosphatase [Rickettsiales bacterium]MDG4544695.1 histidinol-phosphatase [Rickettsiales bacterium]MDG4546817.1 histidinol-phosphatase [Rickettsiales bacterium]
MDGLNIIEIKKFVDKVVDKSEDIICKHYRNLNNIETKDDESPVTIADREAETSIREFINKEYPEHGIIGEEFGEENINARYKWIIDPIDGTLSFMIGRPIFGTLLALLDNGKPILSVINQPITKERWLAVQGEGCKLNGKNAQVKNCGSLSQATIATTGPNYFTKDGLEKFNRLSKSAKHTIYGGDCYLYALVASGFLDLAIDSCLKPHDFMPLIPIVKEAGGIITDWTGNELNEKSDGNVIAAGSKTAHEQAIKILG